MPLVEFGNKIGSGGFGEVFEGTLEGLTPCAIKTLLDPNNEEHRKRFEREVRIQAKLRHQSIIPIISARLDSEPLLFIMPRALFSLRQHLVLYRGENEIWIVKQVAEGLRYAHENGVIHRDLKPENILFFEGSDKQRYAAIGDFGLGRLITRDSPSLTQSNIRMGTIEYMAPEQYRNAKNVDSRADIYALGKILYEVLTGEIPYPDMDYSLVPRKFTYIIQKACQKDAENRYRSIADFISDLEIVSNDEKLLTRPAELLRDEIKTLIEEQDFSTAKLERLARLLAENIDDTYILTYSLPELPGPILQGLSESYRSIIESVLIAYDEAVSGELPFKYCDVVADFYERIFYLTGSDNIKLILLRRLPKMGVSHNRFHVGEVFARIVCGLEEDSSLVLGARDILRDNRDAAAWCKQFFKDYSIPIALRELLT